MNGARVESEKTYSERDDIPEDDHRDGYQNRKESFRNDRVPANIWMGSAEDSLGENYVYSEEDNNSGCLSVLKFRDLDLGTVGLHTRHFQKSRLQQQCYYSPDETPTQFS